MNIGFLNENELEWLDDILVKYVVEGVILDVFELDGLLMVIFFVLIDIEFVQWLLVIWGGVDNVLCWVNDCECDCFVNLMLQYMSDIVEWLEFYFDQFELLFGICEVEGQELIIVEEWCFGYLCGVVLSDWLMLFVEFQLELDVIVFYGSEEQFSVLDNLMVDEFIVSIECIMLVVLVFYQYWIVNLQLVEVLQLIRNEVKVGCNDFCLCGSGKKYKQCCLVK